MTGSIRTVGVVGTGVIGASWTGLFLANGLKVLVSDPAPNAEEKLVAYLNSIWPTLQEIGLAQNASLVNYRFVGASLEAHYGELDFVQENAPERLELKTKLVGEIDAGTRPDVIIASSSSGITSSQFIGNCKHPERVLIGHPFNPPHLMPLLTSVPIAFSTTSAENVRVAIDFYKSLGKRPVLVKKEVPGFAANRLQAGLCAEAYSLVKNGVLSAEDVDACVTSSLGPRWALTGPYMSNISGGGGGKDGFQHMMRHLGPGIQVWLHDMRANEYDFSEESLAICDASVQEMLSHVDEKEVGKQRDEVLISLLKEKRGASALV
ncbi:hypothetical protein LTR97_001453 [Elasticomyces elasticus]|uniref:3-hydroxyacyl-CoA dehydrogenase n=1 Tax=Elasticomyces elasticus TaxID=574655 RepID=A0AAN7ZVX7_9PEZI|nr:hypothetical protein LTR97_001453 [Elasticomyces elasticus]